MNSLCGQSKAHIRFGKRIYEIHREKKAIDPCNFLSLLHNQSLYPKFYWKSREQDFEWAAFGKLLKFNTLPEFFDSHLRIYASRSFDSKAQWKGFAESFILPQWEVYQHQGQFFFAQNSLDNHLTNCILNDEPFAFVDLKTNYRSNFPDFFGWNKLIETSLHKIKKGLFQKVVLGRKTHFKLQTAPPPSQILTLLSEQQEGSTLFGFIPKPHLAFLGASPERLYFRKGKNIYTEACAGTRKRGKTEQEDSILKKELLHCPKEKHEFTFVKEYLENAMQKLCKHWESSPTKIHETSRLQHLYSEMSGELHFGISDANILELLHPTPAMGGIPKEEAIKYLLKNEPFDRGLYASPIGWMSKNQAEFFVGIRSCLLDRQSLFAFSAAGIVNGSNPGNEWEELELKISPFTSRI